MTERTNELTAHLDGSLAPGAFLAALRQADAQIFAGYGDFPSLLSRAVAAEIEATAAAAAMALDAGGSLVFTGCGTSGRIGFLTARRYAADLAPGGDRKSVV